jgi:hypothetical protein
MVTYFKHKSSVTSASSSQTEDASPMQLFFKSIGKTCDEKLNVNQQLQFQITILSELQKLINKNEIKFPNCIYKNRYIQGVSTKTLYPNIFFNYQLR